MTGTNAGLFPSHINDKRKFYNIDGKRHCLNLFLQCGSGGLSQSVRSWQVFSG